MEVDWRFIVDPWKTSVSVVISRKCLLIDTDFASGLWEKRHLVCCSLPPSCHN